MNEEIERQKILIAQMFFPEGYRSKEAILSNKICLSFDDPVLNSLAKRMGEERNGIMAVYGCEKLVVFKYEHQKLKELKPL